MIEINIGKMIDDIEGLAVYDAEREIKNIKALIYCEKNGIFDSLYLFDGTAINKIYFGKYQRISEDLDLMYDSYTDKIDEDKINIFRNNEDILVDIVEHKMFESPKIHEARSLFYYYGANGATAKIRSFSLEYLLAMKTLVFLGRRHVEEKDIFDIYNGFGFGKVKLSPNIEKYKNAFRFLISYDQADEPNMTVKESLDFNKKMIDSKYIEGEPISPKMAHPDDIHKMGKTVYNKLYEILADSYGLKIYRKE